jgi:hypothetical protein
MRTWYEHPAFHSQVTGIRPLIACLILYGIHIYIYLTHIAQCDEQHYQIMVSSYVTRADQVVRAPAKCFRKIVDDITWRTFDTA